MFQQQSMLSLNAVAAAAVAATEPSRERENAFCPTGAENAPKGRKGIISRELRFGP